MNIFMMATQKHTCRKRVTVKRHSARCWRCQSTWRGYISLL